MINMPFLTEEEILRRKREELNKTIEETYSSSKETCEVDEDTKRSNLKFKLGELPRQIREYFFQDVTISKVLDALREVKSIDTLTTVIKYIYSVPVVDILPEDESREHAVFSYEVMNLNYWECIDLLELMITYLSDDDEPDYKVE